MNCPYLFVYGTLKSDGMNANAQNFHQHAYLIGHACWQGRLYLVSNYPGAVPSAIKTEYVLGEVWQLHSSEQAFSFLDEYEECAPQSPLPYEYERVLAPVQLGGQTLTAWIYLYRLETAGLRQILSGEFTNDNQQLIRRAL
jgi:gamma-glutamylcyclotransferase (GGCT)/AIG2-like uncharacterized protein YtfP